MDRFQKQRFLEMMEAQVGSLKNDYNFKKRKREQILYSEYLRKE